MEKSIKEKINHLIEKLVEEYGADDDTLGMVEKAMNTFIDYVNHVATMESRIIVLRFRLDEADLRTAIQEMDRTRRNMHEAAIASCNILNRMNSDEPIYSGDVNNRYQVADFCIAFVNEMFRNGQPEVPTEPIPHQKYVADYVSKM